MFKTNSRLVTLLIVLLFVTVSCRKPVAAPPPPPPPPAPAPPPPPAPTITLRAAPETVERGQGTTLTWQATNAGNVAIEPGIGNVPGNGNRQVTPASSVTYTATATGPGGTATDTVRVTVNVPPPPPAAAPPRPAPPAPSVADLFRQNVQNILFDYDKSDIRPDQVGRLQGNANFLRQQGAVRITVEGHADERGSQEYNLGLGDRRANAVKQFLVAQGIAEGRINVITYGEERPECREMTEDCYSRNRRGAFVLNP